MPMTPTTTVEVIGSRSSLVLSAIVDTGFSGDICIPIDIAVGLGLELVRRTKVELADGSSRSELLFAGLVRFVGEERDVEILVTDRDDPLVGVGLLAGCRLAIDFTRGTLSLTRPNKKAPRR